MAEQRQDELPEVDANEWREATFRNAFDGALDEDALNLELARFRALQELREKKLEVQRRREKLRAFLQHPGWIAVAPTMLCVYSHFTFGLATLPSIVFHQIVFLRPPSDFTQVPVTVGLLVTALLSGSVARRSLKDSIPALALLFDLCCLGLVVVWTPSFLLWIFAQIRELMWSISFESICARLGLDPWYLRWIVSTLLAAALYIRFWIKS